MSSLKVVLVGDSGCGKTSLVAALAGGGFGPEYSPTVIEDRNVHIANPDTGEKMEVGESPFSCHCHLSIPFETGHIFRHLRG